MKNVVEKLKSIYSLQLIHSEIDKLHHLRGELPIEVEELESEIEGLSTRKEKMLNEVNEMEDSITQREKQIIESKNIIVRYEKQIEGVKNNREFEALNREIEVQKLEIQIAEKNTLKFSEQVNEKTQKIESINAEIVMRKEDLERKKKELEGIMTETEIEEKKLIGKVNEAEKNIDKNLLVSYNKLRNNFVNKKAVCMIERESCSGCFNLIPPQRQVEIRLRKKINICEHCGRVIVDEFTIKEVNKILN